MIAAYQAKAGDITGALKRMAAVPPGLPDTRETELAVREIAAAQARADDPARLLVCGYALG